MSGPTHSREVIAMPPKKRASSTELSRLTVLAAGDEGAFASYATELLRSGDRLAREAALAALLERPLPSVREPLRDLYFELAADGLKRDQGATLRVGIVRILAKLGDVRDRDVAINAASTFERVCEDDLTWTLRVHGLRMVADLDPALFPYYAVEHLDDNTGIGGEPANTASQLLAGTGNYVPIYQWLLAGDRHPALVAAAFELLAGGPREIVERFAAQAMELVIRRADEALATALAEAIVNLELENSYDALSGLMAAKLSDELYNYLAVLLAGTNRAPLLAILEHELHRGRRPRIIAEALRIRTTPEQAAILRRWEEDEGE